MKAIRRISILVLFITWSISSSFAQQSPFSVGLQAGVSYSGWNLALIGQYHFQRFSAYLGPSISLNRGLPGKGPAGFSTGANYFIPSTNSRLSSLINVDYQFNFSQASHEIHSALNEFHLSYGIVFKVTEHFSMVQQMGYGFYLEQNKIADKKDSFTGYGGLLRIKADYRF